MEKKTWADYLFARSIILSDDKEKSNFVRDSFCEVALEWADRTVDYGNPFSSGITQHGEPVELSVKVKSNKKKNIRFIAQPGRIGIIPAEDVVFAKKRAIQFIANRSGLVASSIACAILKQCLTNNLSKTENFHLWIGQDFENKVYSTTKLYFNPWFSIYEKQIALLIDQVMRLTGIGDSFTVLNMLLKIKHHFYIHIIGINFDERGAVSLKIYFVLNDVSIKDIAIIESFLTPCQRNNTAEKYFTCIFPYINNKRGQAHGAIVWNRDEECPFFRASIFCPDWFSSDRDVLHVVNTLLNDDCFSSEKEKLFGNNNDRKFTFLTIGLTGNVVLYSRL